MLSCVQMYNGRLVTHGMECYQDSYGFLLLLIVLKYLIVECISSCLLNDSNVIISIVA